ncbi:MAG TPA: ABC transporter substrate-binding protein [Stellaceae bacterium]|nr:ABC transporter substrate-binding protein [Stellaceae bacterium]
MLSRNFARAVMLVLAMAAVQPGPARAASDPAGFIADLGQQAMVVLTSQRSEAEREGQFRTLFDTGFDVPAVARFALGRYWTIASPAQQQEFTTLFTAYMVHVYAVRFNEFTGQQFKVTGSRPEGDASTLVTSQLGSDGNQPVKIDWRVAKVAGGFKITDIVVEGISMMVTQRQEFSAVIQRGGGDIEALLKPLRAKVRQS